jgi:hypothetical protein
MEYALYECHTMIKTKSQGRVYIHRKHTKHKKNNTTYLSCRCILLQIPIHIQRLEWSSRPPDQLPFSTPFSNPVLSKFFNGPFLSLPLHLPSFKFLYRISQI